MVLKQSIDLGLAPLVRVLKFWVLNPRLLHASSKILLFWSSPFVTIHCIQPYATAYSLHIFQPFPCWWKYLNYMFIKSRNIYRKTYIQCRMVCSAAYVNTHPVFGRFLWIIDCKNTKQLQEVYEQQVVTDTQFIIHQHTQTSNSQENDEATIVLGFCHSGHYAVIFLRYLLYLSLVFSSPQSQDWSQHGSSFTIQFCCPLFWVLFLCPLRRSSTMMFLVFLFSILVCVKVPWVALF